MTARGDDIAPMSIEAGAAAGGGAPPGERALTADEPRDLWRGLLDGTSRIVGRADEPGRRVVRVRWAPQEAHAPLGARERRAIALAAAGESNKAIGFALGVATSTAAGVLESARRKLGLRARRELIELFGTGSAPRSAPSDARHSERAEAGAEPVIPEPPGLGGYASAGTEPVFVLSWPVAAPGWASHLSPSEVEVLELARAGLSSAEIAVQRCRSRRTVENQLASAYRKVGVRGRLELYARFAGTARRR